MLLVDDNHMNLLALELMLKTFHGLECDKVYDGLEAISKVRAGRARQCCGGYVLVFMDINMPILDGYSASLEIRKFVSHVETRIVAVSAYPASQIEERTKSSGMDGAIGKPLND